MYLLLINVGKHPSLFTKRTALIGLIFQLFSFPHSLSGKHIWELNTGNAGVINLFFGTFKQMGKNAGKNIVWIIQSWEFFALCTQAYSIPLLKWEPFFLWLNVCPAFIFCFPYLLFESWSSLHFFLLLTCNIMCIDFFLAGRTVKEQTRYKTFKICSRKKV